ncbi:MAG: PAS domain S-box protein, partial [Ferruginibacter sp.]
TLVEQSLVGVFILQEEKIIYVNPAFENITGYTSDQLIHGMSFGDLIHEEDVETLMKNFTKRMSGEKLTDQYTLKAVRSDGALRHIKIIISTIIYNGAPAIIGTSIDITDSVEEEIRLEKAVTDAQEKERIQMGMELHDNVKQLLAASILYLDFIKGNIDKKIHAVELIGNVHGYIKMAINELTKLSHRLAPSIDAAFSLADKINELVNDMNMDGKLNVTVTMDESYEQVNMDIQLACYRIVQEQFSNIVKYAQASSVVISIEYDATGILMSINDDGKGFDTRQKKQGIGLENIRRRVKLLRGTSKILSSPGNGCKVITHIPMR